MPDWRWVPDVTNQVYWERIGAFQLQEDTYGDWVAFAVKEGRFRYAVGGVQGEASFGDIVFCPPGDRFQREVLEELSFYFVTFRWRTSAAAEAGGGEAGPMPKPAGGVSVADRQRLSSNYFYMEQLQHASPERRLALAAHGFQDLWQLICIERELAAASGRPAGADDPDMQAAALWLRQHAFGPVLLKELAAQRGCTPVQFTRRFQAALGVSPMEYVTALRLQHARTLLLETALTLDEIAEQCGYENGFYLSRVFSRKLQVSPSAYRKLHRV
ncbi:AraC family transcriptional regulator [Paenibacillus mucilaginosus 3016]|uniref:AraC family transcriptional regulator n=1 Tax=Paenibacillus mucilaginosus 3016 TaxID=1116391 RepID=H6NRA3_9BACL|nr:AraC family transcriptional regulator [Paenibacillus mucilaginosus]AFC33538.1 AraC family transcriptional regulator [Paenibacillus mucilaginosus 3016]WFA21942.1 AraC family transcriptional regulator [Paenibacillus mucilaginosus]